MPPRKRRDDAAPADEAQAIQYADAPPEEPATGPDTPSGVTERQMFVLADRLEALAAGLERMGQRMTDLQRSAEVDGPAKAGAPAIYQAIWDVMLEVQGVGKHGETDRKAGGYKFRKYDDLKRELGAACRNHGVMLQSKIINVVNDRAFEDTRKTRVQVHIAYQFTSLADGSEVEFQSLGESIDTSDKATGKAMTMALKSALDQAFMLAAEDIEDPDQTRPGEDDVPRQQFSGQRVGTDNGRRRADGPRVQESRQADHDAAASRARDAVQRGYPNEAPPGQDEWDQGVPKDTRTPEEQAQAAADALAHPQMDMARWSAISQHAQNLGLMEVMVTVGGNELALKHHLLAVGRTL